MAFRDLLSGYDAGSGFIDREASGNAWQQMQQKLKAEEDRKKLGRLGALADLPAVTNPAALQRHEALQQNINMQEEVSPQERWMNQVNALAGSSNPVLQKKGLDMLSQAHQAQTSKTGTNQPTSYKEYILATPPHLRSAEGYRRFLDEKKAKMFDDRIGQPLADHEYAPLGRTKDQGILIRTNQGPKPLDPAGRKTVADANKAATIVKEMDYMLFNPETGLANEYDESFLGKLKQMGKANAEVWLKNDPRYAEYADYVKGVGTQLVRALGEVGATSDTDIMRLENLIPQVTGLKIDTNATAKSKLDKLSRLIQAASEQGGFSSDLLEVFQVPTIDEINKQKESEAPPGYTWQE